MALKTLNISGEVITTPFSYVATTTAILWEKCTPIFADINPENFCIDPSTIESVLTPRTQAILATHVYGYPCEVKAIEHIAKKHNLKVIYDAAHAFGTKINGKSLICMAISVHVVFMLRKYFIQAKGDVLLLTMTNGRSNYTYTGILAILAMNISQWVLMGKTRNYILLWD